MYPAITGQFASLAKKAQLEHVDALMDKLEIFVVLLYEKSSTRSGVIVVRCDL